MKIAIPVEQKKMDSMVSATFGRTEYFLLMDLQTQEVQFLDSPFCRGQSAGIQTAQLMIDHQVGVVVTARCGEKAVRLLNAGNIQIFQAVKATAQENLEFYCAGTLALLQRPDHVCIYT